MDQVNNKRAALVGVTLLLVASLCAPTAAHAGGSSMSVFGDRRMGMMANLGKPDDPTAVFHLPAGLADQPGINLYLFLSPAFLSSDFRMQQLDSARYPEINPAGCDQAGAAQCPWPVDSAGYYAREIRPERYFGLLPFLAGSTDLGFMGRRGKDVVVGAALYAPNAYAAALPEGAPTSYAIIEGAFLVISATTGVGWRVNRYLSLGVNVSYNYQYLSMSRKVSLADALTPKGQDPNTTIGGVVQTMIGDLRMDFEGTEHGVGWGASALITPLPWLNIGVAYAGATSPVFEGDVHFIPYKESVGSEENLRKVAGQVNYKLPRRLEIEQALPHTVRAGVNVALGQQVELGFDVRFWFYNLFQRQRITPHYNADDKGNEPLTERNMSSEKDYGLSYQVNAGVLVRPLRNYLNLELMLGAGYDQSPIPDHTYSLENPNLSHVKLTTGLRWRINSTVRLSAGYLLNLYISRDIHHSQTSPPTNVQVSSHSHSPSLAANFTF